MAKIGFVGLGNMGLPMALNLVKAGHEVQGFDLAPPASNELPLADSLEAAVKDADAVITMLPNGGIVSKVYGEIFAAAKSGALLIDCSTIDVESARRVAADAEAKNFNMVDAPVSGGTAGAAAGTLTFMVGGPDSAFEAAKLLLDAMGKNIFHAGASGNGQAAKICNNMVLGISMIATSEAFALGKKLGLDAQTFFDIANTASGQTWSLTNYCPEPGPLPTSPANRDYAPGFTAAMMLKDLRLAQDAAHAAGQTTPLGAQAEALYALMDNLGQGDKDFSAIIKMIKGEL